ncbi:polysaccharide biosynthesis tyrosine autokinase [Mycolicibacterium vaccae]|uniref:polysaccharide biosynthesis tyrosine autokinase n=1 Tax=Mycolicibacterium vaccae TaxID=1810 RepID=UPI003D040DFF
MKSSLVKKFSSISGWIIGLAVALVAALLALGASLSAAPQYETKSRMYVSTVGGAPVSNASYQETAASQQMALSLVKLITSDVVIQRVVDSLQLDMTAAELTSTMEATVEPETVLIDLSVTSTSPALAREIANATAFEFADYVAELQVKTTPSTPKPQVNLVQPAATPNAAVAPNIPRNVGLATLAGFVIGLTLANLRKRFIHTVRDVDTLESVTGKPALGSVPAGRLRLRGDFATVTRDAAMMESFRHVRTNLVHLLASCPSRVITVTSAGLEEGTTTTVCGIGAALADAGYRVVVVDADLRQAHLTERLNMVEQAGVAEVANGAVEINDVIQSMGTPRLDVLPAGETTDLPSEHLSSRETEKMLRRLGEIYDYVLVDTPPVLAFTDAVILGGLSDGVVLVVRYADVEEEDLRRSIVQFAGVDAPVLGALFTFAPLSDSLKRSLKVGRRS